MDWMSMRTTRRNNKKCPRRKSWSILSCAKRLRSLSGKNRAKEVFLPNLHKTEGKNSLTTSTWYQLITFSFYKLVQHLMDSDLICVFFSCSFGSFFGPSRPVISSRVIQESKSLLETEIKNSSQPVCCALVFFFSLHFFCCFCANGIVCGVQKKRPAPTSSSGVRNVPQEKRPKPVSAVRRKVETLKDTRDYSFLLSDDAELPVPKREPLSRSGSFRNSGKLCLLLLYLL